MGGTLMKAIIAVAVIGAELWARYGLLTAKFAPGDNSGLSILALFLAVAIGSSLVAARKGYSKRLSLILGILVASTAPALIAWTVGPKVAEASD